MKKVVLLASVALLALPFSSCTQNTKGTKKAAQKVELNNQLDSVSYAMGVSVGSQIHGIGVDEWNYDAFFKAFQDAMEEKELKINQHQLQAILDPYFMALQEKQMQKMQEAMGDPDENLQKGITFLENNKNKPTIQVTESGLQYEVIKMGDGPKPAVTDKVKVHYHGTNLDGSVFDSSVERDVPAMFNLNRVIKGWTEGLQLMPVGSKFKFYVPAELGYGTNPPPGSGIGVNAALIFEVELLEIL